jgi:formylglycine-generating enzyme required for sulfatase activity
VTVAKGPNSTAISLVVKTGSIQIQVNGDATAPNIVSGPSYTVSGTDVTVTWTTDEQATSAVCYSQTQGFDYQSNLDWAPLGGDLTADQTSHSVTISGLTDGATYYYVAVSADASGNLKVSDEKSMVVTGLVEMVLIAAAGDSFIMGDGIYGPNVTQTISYNYYMSKFEITNTLFAQFIADGGYTTQSYWTTNGWNHKQSQGWISPAYWNDSNHNGLNQPAAGVSWYEAVAFCNWLSVKKGLNPAYDNSGRSNLGASGYRLPTEIELEYASAKGAPGQPERIYSWGDVWDSSKAICKVPPANALKAEDVGSKSPIGDTPQGLVDITGNSSEWVNDNWQPDANITTGTDRYYFVSDSSSQWFMADRCGCWGDWNPDTLRNAYRASDAITPPYSQGIWIGFRVVRR